MRPHRLHHQGRSAKAAAAVDYIRGTTLIKAITMTHAVKHMRTQLLANPSLLHRLLLYFIGFATILLLEFTEFAIMILHAWVLHIMILHIMILHIMLKATR